MATSHMWTVEASVAVDVEMEEEAIRLVLEALKPLDPKPRIVDSWDSSDEAYEKALKES